MKKLNFTKMHGIGNDFILVKYSDLVAQNIIITKEFVQRICNRNFGIGSDGLIVVDKGVKKEFKFTIYNPDGSEAEMCGNGIRCYMKYLVDNVLTEKNNVDVETKVDVLNLQIKDDLVTVSMGTPKIIQELAYKTKKLGDVFMLKVDDRAFKFTPISMGNPHAVIFLKPGELSSFDLEKYGKSIENNTEIFPKKTNVEFLEVLSSTEMNMRVWERGTGETLACGTGTCASVVAGILAGYLEKDTFVKVNLLGGILEIKWSGNKNDQVIMKGKAETTFEGVYFVKE